MCLRHPDSRIWATRYLSQQNVGSKRYAVHADPVHFVRHSLTYIRSPILTTRKRIALIDEIIAGPLSIFADHLGIVLSLPLGAGLGLNLYQFGMGSEN